MHSLGRLFQCLSWLVFLFISPYPAFSIPKLGRLIQQVKPNQITKPSLQNDMKISYYPQTLDHFNYQPESYATFKQKYMVYSKQWGGARAKAPILVYLGDEAPMYDDEIDSLILPDYASQLKALLVIIEHRFYGESIPFGMSMEEVLKNTSIRGYFNSAQAIADYAEVILYLKQRLNAHYSPVIVAGGSYGGMLASWFRLKYPHIAVGALASSAPVLYFDNIISPNYGYYYVVNKDFRETSESCYKTIKNSWAEIDKIGSQPHGLSFLSEKFNTCKPLNDTDELKNLLENLYDVAAQYGNPSPSEICKAISRGSKGTDLLSRINAAVSVYFGDEYCRNTTYWDTGETSLGYAWQTCSEMVMPIAHGTNKESMFPSNTFDLLSFTQDCKKKYNVLPRPHWITSYYGGHDMKLVLKRFGSNIIFSNGLKDPYSSAGVLENLSDTIIAIYTTNGTHCKDISSARDDDPDWLIDLRRREVDIISGWLKKYYMDLEQYLS